MAFSIVKWVYPKLPVVTGITWTPGWPDTFAGLPKGIFRSADNSSGVITGTGEGSANVAVYIDTWSKTPENREDVDELVIDTIEATGMLRRSVMHTEEIWPDNTKAYRSSILFAGEYDHNAKRMCTPQR